MLAGSSALYRAEHIPLVSDTALLEDPLAALFRPALAGRVPLDLDVTELRVELSPPRARVVVSRRFTNRTGAPIEAVMTLPPPARGEVVRAVSVSIDGVAYDGHMRARTDARTEPSPRVTPSGERHAIAHELIEDLVQLVAVSAIAPGAEVVVRVESVRPLDLHGAHLASLSVPIGANAGRVSPPAEGDSARSADAPPHRVTLAVVGEGVLVAVQGHEHEAPTGVPFDIAPSAHVSLGIRSVDGTSLGPPDAALVNDPHDDEGTRFVFADSAIASRDDGASLRALARAELPVRDVIAPPPTDEATPEQLGPTLPIHPDP
jgi:hypothetical protein